ncbi:MAG: trigger factor [Chlamydiae bacterium]|nr:trigger factor [Chlamydiota bacterium]
METSTAEAQELSNNLVRFTIHKRPSCRVEFEVQASKELVSDARKKAVRLIAKEVSLPGFRKGKAPDALIVKNFSKDVDKKWQEFIADLAFKECEKIAKIPILSRDARITFNMKNHSQESAEFSLVFETEPEIPSVNPHDFQPNEVEKPVVNQEKVNETIRQVRFFFAEWKKINDRPVQQGDFVLLDVDVIEQDPPSSLFKDTRFEVDTKYMAQWMKDLVLGKELHDVIEGMSVADEDAKDKDDFKPQKVRVKIKAIEQATLPDMTEDFLKNLGVASEEELVSSIEKLLEKQAEEHVKEKLHEQVNEFLMEKYPFDLPPTLIDKEAQYRMKQLGQDPNFQKYWQTLSPEDKKKTLDSIYKQSEKAVRMFYMCRKIIADAKINISPLDLPKPATTPLEILMDPDQMLHFHEQSEVKHAEALSKLVLQKAADYIVENSKKA